MTFTFSNNEEVDYAALGMCPICAIRFTHGCEHSNTLESQEWLAAHAVAENGLYNTEAEADSIHSFLSAADAGDVFVDAWCDERIDTGLIELNAPYRPAVMDTDDLPF